MDLLEECDLFEQFMLPITSTVSILHIVFICKSAFKTFRCHGGIIEDVYYGGFDRC